MAIRYAVILSASTFVSVAATARPMDFISKTQEWQALCVAPWWPSPKSCDPASIKAMNEVEATQRIDDFWRAYDPDPGAVEAAKRMLSDFVVKNKEELMTPEQIVLFEQDEQAKKVKAEQDEQTKRAKAQKAAWEADHPTPEKLKTMRLQQVCRLARGNNYAPAVAELRIRSLFSNKDLSLILNKKISIGMAESALTCSWGEPSDTNRTVTASSVNVQYVYGQVYVYSENGKVTAWQD